MTELSTPELERELTDRGVNPALASELLHQVGGETVASTIRWFDSQRGRVGPGVLVEELRKGGRPRAKSARSVMDEQREYARQITAWLAVHFPDLIDPRWGPHPAAVDAVIHLHHRLGKHGLSAREHGPEIRAAVARFDTGGQAAQSSRPAPRAPDGAGTPSRSAAPPDSQEEVLP